VAVFQPLQELDRLLGQAGTATPAAFPPNSRYNTTPVATLTAPDGTQVVYLRRRFVPPPEVYAAAGQATVAEGDRLDNLANSLLGDPALFWRLCDANRALRPAELEAVGRVLVVPLPQGVPAMKASG
jgi:hypothetical protein